MSADIGITKENINEYFQELGKEYRKLTGGNMDAEVIIVGGGAIVLNHGFREATDDIDVMIERGSLLETAAEHVSDKLGISPNWFNTDFQNTSSYSDVLWEVSVHYRTFSNHVDIRIVPDEYVVAMKLVSDRDYKHDHSDIVGILRDNADSGKPLSKEQIVASVERLYGAVDAVSARAWEFLDDVLKDEDYDKLYKITSDDEQENKLLLTEEEEINPGVLNTESIEDILKKLHEKEDNGIE